MAAAWTIGKIFKIPIRVHYSMLLLLLTYNWIPGSGVMSLLFWAGLMVLVFGSILLHEIGHALAARRYGIKTHDIVLTPIGGIARLAGMPKDPKQEITIAIAGPAVSFALYAILLVAHLVLPGIGPLIFFDALFEQLSFINLMLGMFNLIPALPMDGGRVLRGLLALKYDHLTATRKAATVARILAVAGAAGSVLGSSMGLFAFHWTYLIIAVFVYTTAGMELRMAQARAYQEQQASQGGGGWPFGGNSSSRPGVYTKSWNFTSSPFGRDANAPNGSSEQPDQFPSSNEDWSTKADPRDVVVISGGKAEIVSRNDPDKK